MSYVLLRSNHITTLIVLISMFNCFDPFTTYSYVNSSFTFRRFECVWGLLIQGLVTPNQMLSFSLQRVYAKLGIHPINTQLNLLNEWFVNKLYSHNISKPIKIDEINQTRFGHLFYYDLYSIINQLTYKLNNLTDLIEKDKIHI